MRQIFSNKILGIFLIGFLLFLSSSVMALYVGNYSEKAFCDNSTTNGNSLKNEGCPEGINRVVFTDLSTYITYSIRELVIKSAGYFLQGLSYINTISQKTELSGIEKVDFSTLNENVNYALETIYNAWYYYGKLRDQASRTPYNQKVIEELIAFDYDTFQDANGLLKEVFQEVRDYLNKGDVVGVYAQLTTDMEAIFNYMEEVRIYFYWGLVPPDNLMWDLNQKCAKTHLFGQYVARVFAEIN